MPMDKPFMEYPNSQYKTALDAMADAISKLRALQKWDRWITFCAQGQGTSPGHIHVAEIRILGDVLNIGRSLNVEKIIKYANVPSRSLVYEAGRYLITAANPVQAARLLDAIFRQELSIHPFAGECDYAVGAEWQKLAHS